MRERPNNLSVDNAASSDARPNDLYRSLEPTFEHLLQSDDPDRYTLLGDLYVRHEEMERALLSYCSGMTSAAAFLVGPTGIGKSTLIRHALNVNRSPSLSNGTLLIPFSMNQRHIEDDAHMRLQMAKVIQEAVWLTKGEPHHYSSDDIREIATFLSSSSPDLLNDPSLDLTKSRIERTEMLSRTPGAAYQFSQVALKHFAAKNENVDRIVLIIDDIEGKAADLQEAAITNALETRACLLNTHAERHFPVRLLIALRPETHIWASRLSQVNTTVFRDITYREPVSLFDIFRRRFDAVFSREDYAKIRDQSRLDQAIGVLDAVGDVLSARFSPRLVRLNNYNLRESLETFRQIVCNRRWLQKDPEWQPYFVAEGHNFAITQAAVMRALGMGEGEVYPQRRTCLANLLHNTREQGSDLLLLYITKFLHLQPRRSATVNEISAEFKRLLGTSFIDRVFQELLDYGISQGLVHEELTRGGIRISETVRARELYAMLDGSSLLLELYRDDICQPLHHGRPQKTTMALMGAGERFVAVATLITQLWEAETRLRVTFGKFGDGEGGSSVFGNIFECARLRSGFGKSVDAFYPPDRFEVPVGVSTAVEGLRRLEVPQEMQFTGA